MRILVAGGAGFIGSHLCEKLAKDHEVIVMDSFITGDMKNIANLDVEVIRQDIRKPFDVKCDLIFNLASPASPVDYQNYPIETLETNSFGMKNILENAKKHNAKVVHASTSEIYGDPLENPQKEEYWGNTNTLGPRSSYDESKRFAETMAYIYHKKFKTNIILVRIFNTYGPRMRLNDGRVIPNFITQALKQKEITVYGDGMQTRSFCYVSDMVNAMEKLAFSGINFDVFNAGNSDEYTMNNVALMIKQLCKSESKLVYTQLPKDDPKKRRPDISKIKKAVGWEPKVKIDKGLEKTIEWFKSELK